MKFLIKEGKNQIEEALVYTISDFLWNNGNTVLLNDALEIGFSEIDGKNALDYCDCIVLFKSFEPFAKHKCDFDAEDFKLFSDHRNLIVLFFSEDGVYTSAIPYPHKIYHFETLNKETLADFLNWTKRWKLFLYT
ncbi:hypothetical protein [Pedobacter sp. ASV28]|uniref:hypothetical protein n=1 Tax=Pedobacter sp. ASV28 TaxID=2795123 RepID=UPI0018ED8400|nr:hypothetical protein [Pedobacter sp. ASV28]